MAACEIDLVLNSEVSGTTSTHVGSARIITGSNTTVSFRGMFGSSTEDNQTGTLEVQKFTGGTFITELKSEGIGLKDISGSIQSVSAVSLTNDWYDFYVSGTQENSSVLIKGIRIVLQ